MAERARLKDDGWADRWAEAVLWDIRNRARAAGPRRGSYPVAAFRLIKAPRPGTHGGAHEPFRRQVVIRTTSLAQMEHWLKKTKNRRAHAPANLWIEEEDRPAVLIGVKEGRG